MKIIELIKRYKILVYSTKESRHILSADNTEIVKYIDDIFNTSLPDLQGKFKSNVAQKFLELGESKSD